MLSLPWSAWAASSGEAMPEGSSRRGSCPYPPHYLIQWPGTKPHLSSRSFLFQFYELNLPSSVLIGWTLLTLPSFAKLSLELTPTGASLGVKDNRASEHWQLALGYQAFRRKREQCRARENQHHDTLGNHPPPLTKPISKHTKPPPNG